VTTVLVVAAVWVVAAVVSVLWLGRVLRKRAAELPDRTETEEKKR